MVVRARPSRKLQERILRQLVCLSGAPEREAILEAVANFRLPETVETAEIVPVLGAIEPYSDDFFDDVNLGVNDD